MTLVVARRCEGRIYMVSDTKLTPTVKLAPKVDRECSGQIYFIGGLKIVVPHPGVAIAFADTVEFARQAIEGIHSCGVDLFDKNTVLDYLLRHHQRSLQLGNNASVEFIAAFILDSGDSELFLVKNGEVLLVDSGYIGDTDSYNSFLHHEHRLTASTGPTPSPLGVATQALDAVIHDPNLDFRVVDGLAVALRQSEENGFVFVHRISVEGRPIAVHSGPMAPVTFGGAPAGANEWTIGSSPGDGFGVLTAFCHTGSFGIIYRPALSFEPRIVRDCTAASLVNESMLEVSQISALLDSL